MLSLSLGQTDGRFCDGVSRRQMLRLGGTGALAGLSLPGLLELEAKAASQRGAQAKSVIMIFLEGGPSHIDTFDYKPAMKGMDGKTIDVKTFGRGGRKNKGRIVETRWNFKQHGDCGQWVSDLFPNFATCVDDVAFLHSMTADSPIHGSAMLMMNSGKIVSGSPCLGSWVNYGLGTQNENLPGFVVMLDPRGGPISNGWGAPGMRR